MGLTENMQVQFAKYNLADHTRLAYHLGYEHKHSGCTSKGILRNRDGVEGYTAKGT